jgi:hypothetical protein
MVLHILIRGQGDRVYSGRDLTNFHTTACGLRTRRRRFVRYRKVASTAYDLRTSNFRCFNHYFVTAFVITDIYLCFKLWYLSPVL